MVMTPTNCMHRAVSIACRFPSRSRSILTRRTDDANHRIRTTPGFRRVLQSHEEARRNFSSAAIVQEDEVDDHIAPANNDNMYRERKEHMPRLHALRERLHIEKYSGTLRDYQLQSKSSYPNLTTELPSVNDMKQIDSNTTNILTDTHGRHHNYLRISLSERCNLRCQYCMPSEGVPLSPSSTLLTDDEILRLVRVFVKNGVTKVRLTGGEPLLRPNLVSLVRSISDVVRTSSDDDSNSDAIMNNELGLVGITTNGISLSRHIDDLVDAGLTGVNISLDTLSMDKFLEITRRNGLDKVLRAIGDCIDAFRLRYGNVRLRSGGSRVKINCVVMRGINDDELSNFVTMADERFGGDIDIRFIEWMPFNDNGWNTSRFISYKDMLEKMSHEGMELERIEDGANDTTKWWRVQQQINSLSTTRIGFITSMSEHFCSSCNRLRITADGKIKVCLFGSNEKEVSLRDIMRKHQHEDLQIQEEALGHVIYNAVQRKTFALGGHGSAENIAKAADNRPMTLIGG